MKITTNHIASTLEEMAYQERGDLGHLILASLLVKKCTDEQLGEAFHEMLTGAFRIKDLLAEDEKGLEEIREQTRRRNAKKR